MEKYYKIISTCCYIRDNNKILMIYRNKKDSHSNKQSYRGLGGKAEQGESPIDCIKREVKEEAGIDIEPIWRGVVTFSNPSDKDWEAHIFTAEGFKGELVESDEGKLCWVDESEILNLDMPEADKKLIPLLFREERFHAHVVHDNNKNLISLKVDKI